MKIRTASFVLAPAALAAAAALAFAGAASAATVQPAVAASEGVGGLIAGPFCSGDVCTAVYRPLDGSSNIMVEAWARNSTFGGQFELQVPGVPGARYDAAALNRAGQAAWIVEVPQNPGTYTVTGWEEGPVLNDWQVTTSLKVVGETKFNIS